MEEERKKFYTRIPFIHDSGKKIPKKIEKKIKKQKNLFLALFLAKTGWDRPRKREKNFSPEFRSYPTRARKFEIKNSKKIQKILKVHSDIISVQNGLGEGKNEKKKKFIPEFRSYSTRARKFRKKKQKNSRN